MIRRTLGSMRPEGSSRTAFVLSGGGNQGVAQVGMLRALLERDGMPAYTPATITDPDLLIAHLEVIRKQGYAVDEGEQEIGVRCFAVAVPDAPGSLAISTSGPQTRMTDDAAARIVPALQRTAREISETIAAEGAS